MKQSITSQQFLELTNAQLERLSRMMKKSYRQSYLGKVNEPHSLQMSQASIGIMIELLNEHGFLITTAIVEGQQFWYVESPQLKNRGISFMSDLELVDALWGALKEVLIGTKD